MFHAFKVEERFCRVVELAEIGENDFNLNIDRFVTEEKHKIFTSVLQVGRRPQRRSMPGPVYYLSGAKVLFRRRMELLHITIADTPEVEITFRDGFLKQCKSAATF